MQGDSSGYVASRSQLPGVECKFRMWKVGYKVQESKNRGRLAPRCPAPPESRVSCSPRGHAHATVHGHGRNRQDHERGWHDPERKTSGHIDRSLRKAIYATRYLINRPIDSTAVTPSRRNVSGYTKLVCCYAARSDDCLLDLRLLYPPDCGLSEVSIQLYQSPSAYYLLYY